MVASETIGVMGWPITEVIFGFLSIIILTAVAPVVINKTTDFHFDWIKPILREIWTGLFIFLSIAYLFTSAQTREVSMKLHGKVPELAGYVICGAIGMMMFAAFWWFTGKALTPSASASTPNATATPSSTPSNHQHDTTRPKNNIQQTGSGNIAANVEMHGGSGNTVNFGTINNKYETQNTQGFNNGNLKQRTIALVEDIRRDLARHGWVRSEE